ncbi:MAG TPA: response regulator [archaeon]|nr:response regulator [archaeon]
MKRKSRKRHFDKQAGGSDSRGRHTGQNQRGKPENQKDAEPQKGDNRHSRANMVVLVDDDPAYVEMESLAVVNYISGFNPMGFTGPGRALNYITNPRNEGRIGLVLLNMEIPPVDGRSVDNILEILKQKRNIQLALVSSSNTSENVARALKLGAVGFLPKVFTMEVFVRFVKNILRNGYSKVWQCCACGKLVPGDLIDMLNMRPLKCTDKNCESSEIKEVFFGTLPEKQSRE